MFPQEAVAAIRACKAVADLPVMATMFFQYEELHDRDRTMWGESPADVARELLGGGGRHRRHELRARSRPRHRDHPRDARGHRRAAHRVPERGPADHAPADETTYELGPEAMAKDYPALLDAGCNIVGGCCGSDPEHIRLIAEVGALPPHAVTGPRERPHLSHRGRPRHCRSSHRPRRGAALPGLQEGRGRPEPGRCWRSSRRRWRWASA